MASDDPVSAPNAKLEREARDMRARLVTEEIKALPLPAVMERVFGLAGTKASAGWLKYRLGDGTLLSVQTEGSSFGSLDGRKFASLKHKIGDVNAINLVLAVKEANGQSSDFLDARKLLQRTFLPHTVESYGLSKGGPRIQVGDVDLSYLFHQDAVIADGNRFDLVLAPWDASKWRTGAVVVIECDHEGNPLPDAKERAHSNTPDLFLQPDKKTHGPIMVVRSLHPLIPDGLRSTDASLLLVPYGPFKGMMLGQLTQEHLATLRLESRSEPLRQAIDATKPLTLQWAQKSRHQVEVMEDRQVDPPAPLNFIRLEDRMVDNRRITRDYLIHRRGLDPALVEQALTAKQVIPFESFAPVYNQRREQIPDKFDHFPAFAIPFARWGETKPIGYQLKVIHPEDLPYKRKDGFNFGKVSEGYTLIGELNQATRDIVLVEAYIDGLSYKQLKDPPSTTCIVVTHGAKVPERIIAYSAERDIKITTGLDNDITGRRTSERVKEECEKRGVRYANDIPGPLSEVNVAFRASDVGQRRLTELKQFCEWKQIAFRELPANRGWLQITLDNTAESTAYIDQLKVQYDRERAQEKAQSHSDRDPPRNMAIKVLNKDWNDQLRAKYRRTVGHMLDKTEDVPHPHELAPTPDIVAQRQSIDKFFGECTVTSPEAREIWVAEVDREVRRTGKPVNSLTLGELHKITARAASLYADRLEERLIPDVPEREGFDALGFVADVKRLTRDYAAAKPADRPAIEKEVERMAQHLDGPGTTTVPLKVAALDFLRGAVSLDLLTQRAVRHAAVVSERIGRGLEIGARGHAHTR